MAYNSKYTGQEVENLLDKASSSDASNFAVCDSSGSAMIKKVTIEGFQLLSGVQVRIKFLNSATTSPMILNVNDTGSFACYYKGKSMHMGWCPFIADKIYTFTYDGESWILEGDWDSVNKQDTLVSGTTIKTINGTSILGEGDISIPDEVELIEISGDMLADEPTYTVTEAQAIIDAYNANKLIAIKCGTRINFGKGWFIPNINIRTQSGMSQIFLSGILGNYYIEHRIIYNTSAGTISASAQNFIDLSESGGSSEGGSSAYAEVNHGTSDSTFELTPNTFHIWDEVTVLNLTLGDETAGVANEYLFQFTSGSEPTTLVLPDGIKWESGSAPNISQGCVYQMSILKGFASSMEYLSYIYFYVNGEKFTAEPNMTWDDFVNSSYNDGSFYLFQDGMVYRGLLAIYTQQMSSQIGEMLIIANGNYISAQGSGGGN